MAVEALAPIVELALYAIAAVAEFSIYVVMASIRPWRYVLSSSYRQKFDAQYASRHPLFKWLALIGGFVLLVASAIIAYGAITFFMGIHDGASKQHATLKERALSSAASAATQWAKSKSSSAQ